jgi:hypothetical protein
VFRPLHCIFPVFSNLPAVPQPKTLVKNLNKKKEKKVYAAGQMYSEQKPQFSPLKTR